MVVGKIEDSVGLHETDIMCSLKFVPVIGEDVLK